MVHFIYSHFIRFICFVVAMYDLVHDVAAMHGLRELL